MSTQSATGSGRTALVGVIVGALLLAVVAVFAIILPRVQKDNGEPGASASSAGSTAPIKLPDTLPGGYVATDVASAFVGTQAAANAATILPQQQAARAYSDKVLSAAFGVPTATRTYVTKQLTTVTVQATRSSQGAFPVSVNDPTAAQAGQQLSTVQVVGDAVCNLIYAPASQTAKPAATGTAGYTSCETGGDGLTVVASGQGVVLGDLVAIVDAAHTALA